MQRKARREMETNLIDYDVLSNTYECVNEINSYGAIMHWLVLQSRVQVRDPAGANIILFLGQNTTCLKRLG